VSKRVLTEGYITKQDIKLAIPRVKEIEQREQTEAGEKQRMEGVRKKYAETEAKQGRAAAEQLVRDVERLAKKDVEDAKSVTKAEVEAVRAELLERAKARSEAIEAEEAADAKAIDEAADEFLKRNPWLALTGGRDAGLSSTFSQLARAHGTDIPVKATITRLLAHANEAERAIMEALTRLDMSTTVRVVKSLKTAKGKSVSGLYDAGTDVILLDMAGGLNLHAFLHEATHAATIHRLSLGLAAQNRIQDGKQVTAEEAALANSAKRMVALYENAAMHAVEKGLGKLGDMYGFTNVGEFVAEALSNSKFQTHLRGIKAPPGLIGKAKSMWAAFVQNLRSLLKLPANSDSTLDAVLQLTPDFFRTGFEDVDAGTAALMENWAAPTHFRYSLPTPAPRSTRSAALPSR